MTGTGANYKGQFGDHDPLHQLSPWGMWAQCCQILEVFNIRQKCGCYMKTTIRYLDMGHISDILKNKVWARRLPTYNFGSRSPSGFSQPATEMWYTGTGDRRWEVSRTWPDTCQLSDCGKGNPALHSVESSPCL